jgi:hypothetical protein
MGKDTMDVEEISVIIWCWRDQQTDTTRLRLVSVETGEAVHLKDGNFVLRISIDRSASLLRCLIRHIASGSEANVQSGLNLRTFVTQHLLDGDTPESA